MSDSLRSYHKFMRDINVTWVKIPSGKTEKDGYTLKKVNLLHLSIELFLHKYRGISDKYLINYIGLYKLKDRNKNLHRKSMFFDIYKRIINSLCALRYEDFKSDFSFTMI